jgi:hypothetical protein
MSLVPENENENENPFDTEKESFSYDAEGFWMYFYRLTFICSSPPAAFAHVFAQILEYMPEYESESENRHDRLQDYLMFSDWRSRLDLLALKYLMSVYKVAIPEELMTGDDPKGYNQIILECLALIENVPQHLIKSFTFLAQDGQYVLK